MGDIVVATRYEKSPNKEKTRFNIFIRISYFAAIWFFKDAD